MSQIQLTLFRESVTWTHTWRRGQCRYFSTRKGILVGRDLDTGGTVVRFRSVDHRVAPGDVRLAGEPTALTEAILDRGSENGSD